MWPRDRFASARRSIVIIKPPGHDLARRRVHPRFWHMSCPMASARSALRLSRQCASQGHARPDPRLARPPRTQEGSRTRRLPRSLCPALRPIARCLPDCGGHLVELVVLKATPMPAQQCLCDCPDRRICHPGFVGSTVPRRVECTPSLRVLQKPGRSSAGNSGRLACGDKAAFGILTRESRRPIVDLTTCDHKNTNRWRK